MILLQGIPLLTQDNILPYITHYEPSISFAQNKKSEKLRSKVSSGNTQTKILNVIHL
jgi:hypothetical protein